jgi:N-acetylneuraminic acid mutarotase
MATDGGVLYSAAGVSSDGQSYTAPLTRLYRYDPDTGAWTRRADMTLGRDYPQAAFLDGKLYVAGGWLANGDVSATTEVYDPATDTWTFGPDMPTGVAAAAVAVLDNRMYVVGGCTTDACGTTTVQVYDPAGTGWETAAAYPEPVSFEGCGTITAKLYCAGGTSDAHGASRNVYAYDPGTDRWTQVAGMPYGDQWAAAYSAADGKLLMIGGVIDHSSLMTNQGWAYDPGTDSWASLPNANTVSWRSAGACGFYKVGGAALTPALVNAEVLPSFGDCASAGNVSWLTATPGGARTLQAGEKLTVTVTLDAGVDQPGAYTAALSLSEDTPYPYPIVPVTITVTPPKSWGKIAGTVTGTSCTGASVPLSGATVSIEGQQQAFTLKTATDGTYQPWLDAGNSPLDITVGKNGWAPAGQTGVRLAKGRTTTADFVLTPAPPC